MESRCRIVSLPCPELVEFVERGETDSPALPAAGHKALQNLLAVLFFLADYLNLDTIDGFLAHGVVLLVFYLPVSGWRGVSESNRLLLSLRSATVREWLAPYNNPA